MLCVIILVICKGQWLLPQYLQFSIFIVRIEKFINPVKTIVLTPEYTRAGVYTGWPLKNGTVDTVDFSGLCSDQQLSFFTLLDRASFPHYNNTKIIKFGWELFILGVISYGLSFSGFARFQEFRGTINDSFSSKYMRQHMCWRQHSTSYKEISVPMPCLDRKSLLGNTRITEHNTRSIHGRPKLSLIVPLNSGNQANHKNYSPFFFGPPSIGNCVLQQNQIVFNGLKK